MNTAHEKTQATAGRSCDHRLPRWHSATAMAAIAATATTAVAATPSSVRGGGDCASARRESLPAAAAFSSGGSGRRQSLTETRRSVCTRLPCAVQRSVGCAAFGRGVQRLAGHARQSRRSHMPAETAIAVSTSLRSSHARAYDAACRAAVATTARQLSRDTRAAAIAVAPPHARSAALLHIVPLGLTSIWKVQDSRSSLFPVRPVRLQSQ